MNTSKKSKSELDALVETFGNLVRKAEIDKTELTVEKVLDQLQISGFSMLCIILSLPFMQPIPLGPFAIFAGAAFTGLGLQILRGQETPWLPEKLRTAKLSNKSWKGLVSLFSLTARLTGYFAAPRYKSLITGETGRKVVGTLVFISGLLMSIPMFGIPFNNTLPALVVLFVCIAELQDDGVFVYLSLFALLLTVLYFIGIFVAFYFLGARVIEFFGLQIPGFLQPYLGL